MWGPEGSHLRSCTEGRFSNKRPVRYSCVLAEKALSDPRRRTHSAQRHGAYRKTEEGCNSLVLEETHRRPQLQPRNLACRNLAFADRGTVLGFLEGRGAFIDMGRLLNFHLQYL